MIKAYDINHEFAIGSSFIPILHHINLDIKEGAFVSLCGPSGSGKSTLLNLLAGLMKPTKGEIIINNQEMTSMDEDKLCLFRQKNMGFIFQSYNLITHLTAIENVELPLVFAGMEKSQRILKVKEALAMVGLENRMDHKPSELSGGQQQRVSIARAIVTNPPVVLADEPTGNLDSQIGREILYLLKEINKFRNTTFVIVTHDNHLAQQSDRIFNMKDGYLIGGDNC